MPPYIDGISDPPQLFYDDGSGHYVPFSGIQQATIINEIENDPGCVIPDWTSTGELCFTARLTPRSSRRFWKTIHAWNNRLCRTKRKEIRRKEKERRRLLRGGDVMCRKQPN